MYFTNTSFNHDHPGRDTLLTHLVDKDTKVSRGYVKCEANERLMQVQPNTEAHGLFIFLGGSMFPYR